MAVSYVEKLLLDYKRSENRWIGLEVERLGLKANGELLRYEPDFKMLLQSLVHQKAWVVDYEVDGNILGVTRNLNAISLEPGSQFEVSLAPRKSLFEIQKLQLEIDSEVKSFEFSRDWSFVGLAVNPWDAARDLKLLPSPRYHLMDRHFETLKGRGRDMMRLSTGLQVNLDFATEKEGIQLLKLSFALAPYLATLFSHSPYYLGKRSTSLSERHSIWLKTDAARSGFLETVFNPTFSLKNYAKYVSELPLMYAYDASGAVFDPQGKALCDLPEELTKKNALAAMRQLFTEVRLKPCCVEIRYFDQVPATFRYAAVALTVGLLYDDENRERLEREFAKVQANQLVALMNQGAELGLRSKEIENELCKLVEWADGGLKRRGFNENNFLEPAKKLLQMKKTPADLLLERFPSGIPRQQDIEVNL